MATIYKGVKGKKLTKILAELDGVQDALDRAVGGMEITAKAELLAHEDEGHSFIEVEKGRVDRYLVLNDERGLSAAMTIEYGRDPRLNKDGEMVGGMEGLMILHHAVEAAGASLKGRSK